MEKKLGSLFDGIGGFPLAAKRNGIRPVWASEIEKFPMAVTMYRFPEMKHMGDITKLHGENLPVVDVIAGGSPCQDLSIAGRRAGLAGMRSGLFLEQVRIIKKCAGRRKGGKTAVEGEQMSLFDLGIWSGKMCREPSQAENQKEQILRESSKKSVVYRRSPYLYLDRRMGHGLLPGLFWDRNSLLLGEYWTLNFGESPRDAEESSLSQILEATVPERYYLSPNACGGIIRRAGNRGKKLPPILEAALLMQAQEPTSCV